MTQKKSYSRFFIILQENERGYALASDKLPTGYAKLEMKNDKCKVSFYVQNLKKEMQPYYMVLICNKKEAQKLIKIGNMNIDDNGRMESSFEYPLENVAGSSMTMDKVVGAAIVKFVDSKIVDVMSGFASKEIPDWKEYDILEDKNADEQIDEIETHVENIENTNIDENIDSNNIFDKYEQSIEDAKNIFTPISETHAGSMEEDDALETSQIDAEADEQDTSDINEENIDSETDDRKHKKSTYDYTKIHGNTGDCEHKTESQQLPIGNSGVFFKNLVKEFEEIFDMCSEIKKCRWFKVSIKSMHDLYDTSDYNKYTVLYYPMIMHYDYIRMHGHFLTGLKYDTNGRMKYLVYGILGTKSRADQPFGGSTGFVTWAPLKGSMESNGLGYWLMFYDIKDSTIAIPIK